MLPHDRALCAEIEALSTDGLTPVLVGADGALAGYIGIADGGGTAQAIETADVVLMGDDLRKLPLAIQLSRVAMRTIRANIALAIGINLAVLALVLLGFGTMWLAVLADMGASLLGMRLLGYRTS